jgi:hypothetical protein
MSTQRTSVWVAVDPLARPVRIDLPSLPDVPTGAQVRAAVADQAGLSSAQAALLQLVSNGLPVGPDDLCGDDVSVTLRPAGDPATWAATFAAVVTWLTTTTIGQAVAQLAIAAAFAAVSKAFEPRAPKGSGETGPYLIEGAANTARPYAPVPIILGQRRVFPALAAPYRRRAGSDGKMWLDCLFDIGVGTFDISQPRIGDTPLSQISGALIETRTKPGDAAITLYDKACFARWLGQEISNNPSGPSDWVSSIMPDAVTSVEILVGFPAGLHWVDSKGRTRQADVAFEVRIGAWDGAPDTATPQSTWSVVEATREGFVRARSFTTSGRVAVHIRRTNPANDPAAVGTSMVLQVAGFQAGPPVTDSSASLIAVSIPVSKVAEGQLDAFNVIATSRVRQVGSGGAGSVVASRNPADLLAALAGAPFSDRPLADSNLDWSGLSAWRTWCIAKGLNCDLVEDGEASVGELMTRVAAVGRGRWFWRNGKLSVAFDSEQPNPVQMFTARNVSALSGRLSMPDPLHGLRVRLSRADRDWATDEIEVFAPGFTAATATRFDSADITDQTSLEQVARTAGRILAEGRVRAETIILETDLEGRSLAPLSRFWAASDAGLIGTGSARVAALVSGGVRLDQRVTLPGVVALGMRLRTADGLFVSIPLQSVSSETDTDVLLFDGVPSVSPAPGDLVAIGRRTLEVYDLVVDKIQPLEGGGVRITAFAYDAGLAGPDVTPTWRSFAPALLKSPALSPAQIDARTAEARARAAEIANNQLALGLADAVSDGVFNPSEKRDRVPDLLAILAGAPTLSAQANALGAATERTAFDAAISALNAVLATLTSPVAWHDLSDETIIADPVAFAAVSATAFQRRDELIAAIGRESARRADHALVVNKPTEARGLLSARPADGGVVNSEWTETDVGGNALRVWKWTGSAWVLQADVALPAVADLVPRIDAVNDLLNPNSHFTNDILSPWAAGAGATITREIVNTRPVLRLSTSAANGFFSQIVPANIPSGSVVAVRFRMRMTAGTWDNMWAYWEFKTASNVPVFTVNSYLTGVPTTSGYSVSGSMAGVHEFEIVGTITGGSQVVEVLAAMGTLANPSGTAKVAEFEFVGYRILSLQERRARGMEDGANVTETRTAAGITGQADWATFTGITTSNMAGRVNFLDPSTGHLAALNRVTDRRLTLLRRADGSTDVTEAAVVTNLGTSAAITGQADWATYTGITTSNMAGRVSFLDSSTGNLAALDRVTDRRLTLLRRADGSTAVTEAAVVTNLGTSAGIIGQGALAVLNSVDLAGATTTGLLPSARAESTLRNSSITVSNGALSGIGTGNGTVVENARLLPQIDAANDLLNPNSHFTGSDLTPWFASNATIAQVVVNNRPALQLSTTASNGFVAQIQPADIAAGSVVAVRFRMRMTTGTWDNMWAYWEFKTATNAVIFSVNNFLTALPTASGYSVSGSMAGTHEFEVVGTITGTARITEVLGAIGTLSNPSGTSKVAEFEFIGYRVLSQQERRARGMEDAANVTETRTAAGITGQADWATYTGITTSNMAGRVSFLDSSTGNLAALNRVTDRRLTLLRRADGSTDVTEAAVVTNLGTAAALFGAGAGAYANSLTQLNASEGAKLTGIQPGADVTANAQVTITAPPTLFIQCDHLGSPLAGQLPAVVGVALKRGATVVSGQAACTLPNLPASITATIDDSAAATAGNVTITGVTANATVNVLMVLDGVPYPAAFAVQRVLAPSPTLPPGGATSATATVSGSPSSATLIVVSGEMTVTTGSAGTITLGGIIEYTKSSGLGGNQAFARWQRLISAVWTDVGSEIAAASPAANYFDGETNVTEKNPGSLNTATTLTGLGANTTHTLRLRARQRSTDTTSIDITGSVTGTGS